MPDVQLPHLTPARRAFAEKLLNLAETTPSGALVVTRSRRELAELTGVTIGTVCSHLTALTEAGVVAATDGQHRRIEILTGPRRDDHDSGGVGSGDVAVAVMHLLELARRYPESEPGLVDAIVAVTGSARRPVSPLSARDDRATVATAMSRVDRAVSRTEQVDRASIYPSDVAPRETGRAMIAEPSREQRMTAVAAAEALNRLAVWETERTGQPRSVAARTAAVCCWLTPEQLEFGIARARQGFGTVITKSAVGWVIDQAKKRDESWFSPPPPAPVAAPVQANGDEQDDPDVVALIASLREMSAADYAQLKARVFEQLSPVELRLAQTSIGAEHRFIAETVVAGLPTNVA